MGEWPVYEKFIGKSQIVNTFFGFAGHIVSFTTTQLCHCNVKAAIDNVDE